MGAEPYWYYVPYQPNIEAALCDLRMREFNAGRYAPVLLRIAFPIGPETPSPGAGHSSIDEALADAADQGTRSILDLDHVSSIAEFGAVAPVGSDILDELYGTEMPTRQMVEQNMDFLDDVRRGEGVYIVLYNDDKPDQIFFGGYSVD